MLVTRACGRQSIFSVDMFGEWTEIKPWIVTYRTVL